MTSEATLLRDVFDHLDAALFAVDGEGRVVHCNAVAERVTGHASAAMVGRPLTDRFPAPFAALVRQAVATASDEGSATLGVPLRGAAGDLVPVEGALWRARTGGVERVLLSCRTRTRADDLGALFEAASDLFFRLDARGTYLDYRAPPRLLLVPPDQIVGRNAREVMSPGFADMVLRVIRETLTTGAVQAFDYVAEIPGLGHRTFEARMVPTGPAEVATLCRDITDRIEEQRRAQASELRLKEAEKIARIGHWVIGDGAEEIYWSDAVYRLLSVDPARERPTRARMLEAIHPDDRSRVARLFVSSIEERTPFLAEHRILLADGRVRHVLLRGRHEHDDAGRYLRTLGTIQDMTHRRQIERQLLRERDRAEEASRAKSEFLANMSHELRTPLNGVIGFAALLFDTDLDEAQRELVNHVHGSAQSLLTIIQDVLDFSKIEARRMELDAHDVDLEVLVAESLGPLVPEARRKGIALRAEVDPAVPRHVRADGARLRQVLVNLVGNAVKFTDQGEVVVSLRPETAEDGAPVHRFEVRDTGIGIDESQRARLFQAFSQGDASTTRRHGGTGLGLVISNGILRLMGGSLELASRPGVGSTFAFTLRLHRPASDDESASAPGSSGPAAILERLERTVLVVEDVEMNRLLVRSLLRKMLPAGRVIEAADGEEALAAVRAERPDLVLMDIHMPRVDGHEATRRIRTMDGGRFAGVPVVALTAHALVEERERCLASGMVDYLTKPIDPSRLRVVLAAHLAG